MQVSFVAQGVLDGRLRRGCRRSGRVRLTSYCRISGYLPESHKVTLEDAYNVRVDRVSERRLAIGLRINRAEHYQLISRGLLH